MRLILVVFVLALVGCARTETIRTSGNTFILKTSAAPACGPTGAARVASQMAAVETLRAGYDRYIIQGGNSSSNISLIQGPGTATTTGTLIYGGGYGTYSGSTIYTPGPVIPVGSHNQALVVVMFREGEPGSNNAIPAKQILGADWQEKVKSGINTCTG